MSRRLLLPLIAAALTLSAGPSRVVAAADRPASQLVIHLERNRNGQVEPMRPDHVFDSGDVIRFRVSAAQDGYLYVLDQGSSGAYTVLYPASGTKAGNHIDHGRDYTVPADGEGWFSIDPPAGFDTVYFLLSPAPLLPEAAPGSPAAVPAPPSPGGPTPLNPALKPRCNDNIFRARGECVDPSAGPAPLPRDAVLPPQIQLAAPHASRDIVIVSEDDGASVSASTNTAAPIVYTFRLAHR